jgi:hypothetical protein
MDDLVKALTVPFVAGFIVQRFLEILDPVTTALFPNSNTKKIALGLLSLAIGCALSGFGDLKIFQALHTVFPNFAGLPSWLDVLSTGIFISGGTEGFNSLMKFANYKKDAAKAAAPDATAPKPAAPAPKPQ